MTQSAATFTVVSSAHSPECIVKATGEIDIHTAQQLREVLRAEIAAAPEKLIVDMADVPFIDSTGLGTLIGAFKQGQAALTQVVLRAPNERVRRVLEVTGLTKVLLVVAPD